MDRDNLTYPCVVGHRIVELTAQERAMADWAAMTADEKIEALLQRVEELERAMRSLIRYK
jgi:enoyl reductase-like protein